MFKEVAFHLMYTVDDHAFSNYVRAEILDFLFNPANLNGPFAFSIVSVLVKYIDVCTENQLRIAYNSAATQNFWCEVDIFFPQFRHFVHSFAFENDRDDEEDVKEDTLAEEVFTKLLMRMYGTHVQSLETDKTQPRVIYHIFGHDSTSMEKAKKTIAKIRGSMTEYDEEDVETELWKQYSLAAYTGLFPLVFKKIFFLCGLF